MTQTNAQQSGLSIRREVYVLGVGTNCVHVRALAQWVAVTQAVCVLFLLLDVQTGQQSWNGTHVGHGPRSHQGASANRSGQTNQVGVDLQTVQTNHVAAVRQNVGATGVVLGSEQADIFLTKRESTLAGSCKASNRSK